MIAELWAAHGGLAYYRLATWDGFYQQVGAITRVHRIPQGAVCGRWTGNMISDMGI